MDFERVCVDVCAEQVNISYAIIFFAHPIYRSVDPQLASSPNECGHRSTRKMICIRELGQRKMQSVRCEENKLRFNKQKIRNKIKTIRTDFGPAAVWCGGRHCIRPIGHNVSVCIPLPLSVRHAESFIIVRSQHIALLIYLLFGKMSTHTALGVYPFASRLAPLPPSHDSATRRVGECVFVQLFDTLPVAVFACVRSCLKIVLSPWKSHRMSG